MTKIVKLNEIATISAGNSAPQDKKLFANGIHNFVRTSDVGKIGKGIIYEARDKLNDKGILKLKKFSKGTILFPKSGASTFLNHRVMLGMDAYVSSHLATIKGDSNKVLDKYLLYILQTIDAANLVADSNYPSLKTKTISEINLALPSIQEQQHITAKLDAVFAEIDKLIQSTKIKIKNYFNLEEISKNNFFSNLSSSLIELEKVAEIINGYAFKSDDFQNSKGVPVIKITNVGIRDFVETNDVNLSKNFLDTHKQFIVKEGDIVFALTRTVINGGLKVAVVPKNYKGALLNQRVASVSTNPKLMNNEFLYSFLSSSMVLDYVLSNVNPLMQPNLSITDLKKLPVPIIPIDKQIAYTQKLKEKEIHFQNIRTIETKKLSELENLKSAILSQELQSKAA